MSYLCNALANCAHFGTMWIEEINTYLLIPKPSSVHRGSVAKILGGACNLRLLIIPIILVSDCNTTLSRGYDVLQKNSRVRRGLSGGLRIDDQTKHTKQNKTYKAKQNTKHTTKIIQFGSFMITFASPVYESWRILTSDFKIWIGVNG